MVLPAKCTVMAFLDAPENVARRFCFWGIVVSIANGPFTASISKQSIDSE
jgi:hypothetical protein